MSEMLVKISDSVALRSMSMIFGKVEEAYWVRPATPAEIKDAHPKCGTCRYWIGPDEHGDLRRCTVYMYLRLATYYCADHEEGA